MCVFFSLFDTYLKDKLLVIRFHVQIRPLALIDRFPPMGNSRITSAVCQRCVIIQSIVPRTHLASAFLQRMQHRIGQSDPPAPHIDS